MRSEQLVTKYYVINLILFQAINIPAYYVVKVSDIKGDVYLFK